MISDVFFPRVNGVSTSIQTFVNVFRMEGHEVTLIAPGYPAEHVVDFEVIRIPSKRLPLDPEDRLMSRKAIRALLPMLKQRNFDIVHIHTPFLAHYAGVEIAEQLGVAVVTSYHTFFEAYFEKYLPWVPAAWLRGIARKYSRTQCDAVDGVISPSHQMLEKLREYGTETCAAVIPTGLDLIQYQCAEANGFREKYGISDETSLLLYVGRVAFEKNIEFLMDMFLEVYEQKDDVKLLIAGEGPALARLKKRAAQMQLQEHILFIGYLERNTELLDCYRSSDVFVFASETETQGLVLLEAMACGLPVVSVASMGSKDVLVDGEGCLVAEADVQEFSDKVLHLLTDREYAAEIVCRGGAYINNWASEDKARDMLEFYSCVQQHKKQQALNQVCDNYCEIMQE
ncbi:MAG: glycosyltransferase [Chromatiales bacterium]|jgi:glycosyltransferase involved in cell wall biosynthesis